LTHQPVDSISFPGFNLPLASASPAHNEMLALEALQLSQSLSGSPAPAISSGGAGGVLRTTRGATTVSKPPTTKGALRAMLLAHPNASQALRDALQGSAASPVAPVKAPVNRPGKKSHENS